MINILKVFIFLFTDNVGGAFSIDPTLGIITVAAQLDRIAQSEYNLVVKATDGGSPSLTTTATVKIIVTISDNAPPKFSKTEYTAELIENKPGNTIVTVLDARSKSSVIYDLVSGDDQGRFSIIPNSGVIFSVFPVDYEEINFFNLTVTATNMAGAVAQTTVMVHVIDENDCQPVFVQDVYVGNISEEALEGSVVLSANNTPLVIKATDGHCAK